MEQHKFGCRKVSRDSRDYKLKVSKSSLLPEKYKIDTNIKVKSQGGVNSCVAHALSSFEEHTFNDTFSTDFIYGFRPFGYYEGEGMNIRDALHTLLHYGDCRYEYCPGNTEVPDVCEIVLPMFDRLKDKCSLYVIESYARIFTERQIKEVLFHDIPVPISIPVRGDLYTQGNIIINEKDKPIDGYHCVLIIGYDKNGWIIQNSWGTSWGKKGIATLPYDYPIDSAWALNVFNDLPIKEPIRWLSVIGNIIYNLLDKFKK